MLHSFDSNFCMGSASLQMRQKSRLAFLCSLLATGVTRVHVEVAEDERAPLANVACPKARPSPRMNQINHKSMVMMNQ